MSFTISGEVRADGTWSVGVSVPNGETVVHSDVARWVALAGEYFSRVPGQRVPTVAEAAAMEAERALPGGWGPTLDGVNVTICDGVTSWSRTYSRDDDETKLPIVREAPCGPSGEAIPATRVALLELDK